MDTLHFVSYLMDIMFCLVILNTSARLFNPVIHFYFYFAFKWLKVVYHQFTTYLILCFVLERWGSAVGLSVLLMWIRSSSFIVFSILLYPSYIQAVLGWGMHSEPHLLIFPQAFDICQAPRRSFAFILDTKVVEFITLVLLRLLHVHTLSVKNLKYIFYLSFEHFIYVYKCVLKSHSPLSPALPSSPQYISFPALLVCLPQSPVWAVESCMV